MKRLVFLLFLIPLMGWSQSASISGTLLIGEKDTAVFAVAILYQDDLFIAGAKTDEHGHYLIDSIAPGRYDVLFKYLTGKIEIKKLDIDTGDNLMLNQTFKRPILSGYYRFNHGYRIPLFEKDNPSGMTLSGEEIKRIAY